MLTYSYGLDPITWSGSTDTVACSFACICMLAQKVIKALRRMFYVSGFPSRFRSDNGRQFVAAEMVKFLSSNGTVCETSSPEHPSSNGQAEAAVKVAKRLLKKCISDGEKDSFIDRLAELNRQPTADGAVPAEYRARSLGQYKLLPLNPNPNQMNALALSHLSLSVTRCGCKTPSHNAGIRQLW